MKTTKIIIKRKEEWKKEEKGKEREKGKEEAKERREKRHLQIKMENVEDKMPAWKVRKQRR